MTRALRFGVIGLPTLALAGFLVCCVNYTKHVEFSLVSFRGETTLDVYVDRLGVRGFTPHADNSDMYVFILPAGQDHITPP